VDHTFSPILAKRPYLGHCEPTYKTSQDKTCLVCLGEDGLLRDVVEGGPRSHHQLTPLTKLQPGLQHNSGSGTISVIRYTFIIFFM
jgi:hypothetical protein